MASDAEASQVTSGFACTTVDGRMKSGLQSATGPNLGLLCLGRKLESES